MAAERRTTRRATKGRAAGKPITPVGPAIEWTDADLDRMSQVTEEDKAAAVASWRRRAPRPMKRLLDAGTDGP
jgi:hypothetical protein